MTFSGESCQKIIEKCLFIRSLFCLLKMKGGYNMSTPKSVELCMPRNLLKKLKRF